MRERLAFVVDAPDDATGPLAREQITAAIQAATGLATTCLGGGSDWDLPMEEIPGGQQRADLGPGTLYTSVSVMAAHLNVNVFGEMPALKFVFQNTGGHRCEAVLVGDERLLQSFATLVRNGVGLAVSATTKLRRSAGAGPIPRTWNP